MLNKEMITKRLALIKCLYKIGIDQSQQSETIASFSILSLHDSIEMFLKLLAEHLNIKSEKFSFLDYWTSIPTLTLKESMRNLNARRVNIKHKGLLPSKGDIEISRVNATDFFEQNTKRHFGVDFSEISLFSLIHYKNVRQHLEDTQKALDEGRIETSIESVAIAFEELISSYENSKISLFGKSPFYFGKDLKFLGSFNKRQNMDGDVKVGRRMSEFVVNVKESLVEIQKAVKIMSFGIDYKKFVKFQILTPSVFRTNEGKYVAQVWGKKKWTKEHCQYCIDFVLDCSIKLQEFDFDIKELIDNQRLTIEVK